VSGEFSGYFTLAGSPYIITDNVTIPFSGFLDVAAGVTVKFNEGAVLHCKGEMYANGTKTNPIIFTSNLGSPYIGSWKGIRLYLAANSRFINCKISYAWWGINAETGHNITIKNTEIFKCGNGTEFNSISIVEFVNNRIHDNINYGINISLYCSFFNIKNNKFYNNYQGCRFRRLTHSDVVDNSIYNNVRGIRLEISRYLLIKNNTINNTGPLPTDTNVTDFDIAFYMYFSYWNLLQNNDIIDTTGSALVLNISFYNQIENTYIKNASAYGIRFNRFCSDNVIQNSTVLDIGKPLISINYSNRDNYFKNNTLTKPNNLYAVEYGEESYGNYFAADNKVNNVVLPIYYRESSQNISSGLNNLLLTEPKLTNIGQVVIVESENFSVKNLKARNGIAGLFTYETHNVTIDNSEMTNNEFGFYFGYNTTNITVVNSTITNSAKKDFYLDEFSNITVLNSSFDKKKIVNRYHSNITIQWYVHVKVIYYKDLEKRFVKRANVIYNEQTLNGTTGSDGTIRFIRITDYVRNDTGKTSFNDYNVSASKINFQPGYAGLGVFVNQSKWVIIEVQINQDPSMTGFVSPGNTHNLKPELSWKKGTDPEKDPLLYLLRIWNVNDASNIIEQNTTISSKPTSYTNTTCSNFRLSIKEPAFELHDYYTQYGCRF
jgi:parallel beta-helix repeat protein